MNRDIPMSYVAFDIETTGLNPKFDKIIEIGAVRIRDGEVAEIFSSFVNPARSLPERIVELTGIGQRRERGALHGGHLRRFSCFSGR